MPVIVDSSPAASHQSLVNVLDAANGAGIRQVQILNLRAISTLACHRNQYHLNVQS